jgi:diaminohydroxyphosphoribosylaminopyrimidine deaminase/5-amino-6-(5-phosphoribosylamino)uracil reductase
MAGPQAPAERARVLRGLGAEIVTVGAGDRGLDLRAVVERLGAMGVTSLLVEGGSEIAASSLAAGILDRALFFVAPVLIGGREAPPALGGRGVAALADAPRLSGVRWSAVGDDLMLEGDFGGEPCSPA